jgi:tetratricopeptide (TPR) repeat protein
MSARSELAISKALELDDRLGEAYASLGLLKFDIDPEGAETAFKRALRLNPSYASAHQWYSSLLRSLGRFEEALAHSQIAVELDPLSAIINYNLAWTYISLGRYDEAMARFKSNIAVNPAFPPTLDGIGSLYRRVYGKLDKAVPWYEKVVASDPGDSNSLAGLGQLVLDLGDVERAEYWISRSRELAPDGFATNVAMHILHIYRGEDDQAADYAQKVLDAIPREWMGRVAAAYLRDRDLRSGRYVEARARYETAFPELLSGNDPAIDGTNYGAAINLALILSATGEMERANLLLDRSQSFIDTLQRLGYDGTWISDVQIYALQGQTAEALAALRAAIDAGWRSLWWYYLEHDKNLDSIRDEPEFKAMVEEVRADIAAQLMRLREAKASGELAPMPKSLE